MYCGVNSIYSSEIYDSSSTKYRRGHRSVLSEGSIWEGV